MDVSDIVGITITLLLLMAGVIVYSEYQNIVVMNKIKSDVYSQITNTTTNKEIVGYIQESCSKVPWYITSSSCEYQMYNTFITPTKGIVQGE